VIHLPSNIMNNPHPSINKALYFVYKALFYIQWATIPHTQRKPHRGQIKALRMQINVKDLAVWGLMATFAIRTNDNTEVLQRSLKC